MNKNKEQYSKYFESMYSDTNKHYTEHSQEYETILNAITGPMHKQHIVDALEEYNLPEDAKSLEYGCGSGLVGQKLFARGFKNVTGCDGFEGMIQQSLEKKCYVSVFKHYAG